MDSLPKSRNDRSIHPGRFPLKETMILFLQIKIGEPDGLEDGKETDPGLPEV